MEALLIISSVLLLYMVAWFVVGTALKRNDVADIAWGGGFILVTWMGWWLSVGSTRSLLVSILITIWGVRLMWHIGSRFLSKKEEDARYKKWRESWTFVKTRSFFQVYLLQGALLFLISAPVLFVHLSPPVLPDFWLYVGLFAWALGFNIEMITDRQLSSFIKNEKSPENRIMKKGLWKYSRHPNYFGEALLWWGIFLIALAVPGAWWTAIGPLTITILVRFVSGVPILEKRYEGDPEFEEYKEHTNIFVPLPRKK